MIVIKVIHNLGFDGDWDVFEVLGFVWRNIGSYRWLTIKTGTGSTIHYPKKDKDISVVLLFHEAKGFINTQALWCLDSDHPLHRKIKERLKSEVPWN